MRLHGSADLAIVAAAALASLVITSLLHAAAVVAAIPAALLVLFLPGYALTAVAFPRPSVNAIERLMLSIGVSLALSACVATLLHLTALGINAQSSTLTLAAITLCACVVAAGRRRPGQVSNNHATRTRLSLPIPSVALLAVAALIAGPALYFSASPPPELPGQGYTLLWAVPDAASASTIHLGVQNMDTGAENYVLRANWGDQPLREWSLQLDPTSAWQTDLAVSGGAQPSGDLHVLLYSADNPATPLRQTVIRRSSLGLEAPVTEQPAAGLPNRVPEAGPTSVPAATPAPTTAVSTAVSAPTATLPSPTAALPSPTAVPATPAPPTPTLTAADADWEALQPSLDAVWGSDTARAVELLDDFVSRYPDHGAAREKLYAALIARSNDLAEAGDRESAVALLERAQQLFPDRGEAGAALARLTPTPLPQPTATTVVRSAPVVRATATPVAAVRAVPPRPAPPQPAPPAPAPAPTPTKVPFRVPSP